MAVGWATATEQDQRLGVNVLNAVRGARRDADRISRADFKDLFTQGHQARALRDVVNLLGQSMLMGKSFPANRDRGFCQALMYVAMHTGVHELSNLRSILGEIRLNGCVGLMLRRRHKLTPFHPIAAPLWAAVLDRASILS